VKFTEVKTTGQLREFMTTPTERLCQFSKVLKGDIMVLGGAGKVGPELVETIVRADSAAGVKRTIHVADLFPESDKVSPARLKELGAAVHRGDLTERSFLESLPEAPHVIFMVGLKFGTAKDWRRSFHINSVLPYLVGERYSTSKIVVFSSGNPYPHTPLEKGGSKESDELDPQGIYGWSIVARECSFATTQLKRAKQKLCFYRLAYAQHLGYGVLVDLARMVLAGEPISLGMPAVNLLSQRDSIDVAIRSLGHCANPPFILNVAGPVTRVRVIVEKMGKITGRTPKFADKESDTALVLNDELCQKHFGPYRDGVDEMIEAAAGWVIAGGEYWEKPTLFGRVKHDY